MCCFYQGENPSMKLIIQIPCYNEAGTLEIALNDLPKEIAGIDEIEYMIINDGSTDDTVDVARRWGVHHVVSFRQNKGLAKGFMAGINECLRQGADIIVNTDADNQYCGGDVETIVRPILEGRADMVIGARPIDATEHFSPLKKRLQHLGSWVVRKASGTGIPDAPSGFRAYSREAALRLNVVNEYTYTLEQIVQAGRNRMAILSVPVDKMPSCARHGCSAACSATSRNPCSRSSGPMSCTSPCVFSRGSAASPSFPASCWGSAILSSAQRDRVMAISSPSYFAAC